MRFGISGSLLVEKRRTEGKRRSVGLETKSNQPVVSPVQSGVSSAHAGVGLVQAGGWAYTTWSVERYGWFSAGRTMAVLVLSARTRWERRRRVPGSADWTAEPNARPSWARRPPRTKSSASVIRTASQSPLKRKLSLFGAHASIPAIQSYHGTRPQPSGRPSSTRTCRAWPPSRSRRPRPRWPGRPRSRPGCA